MSGEGYLKRKLDFALLSKNQLVFLLLFFVFVLHKETVLWMPDPHMVFTDWLSGATLGSSEV